MAKNYNFSEEEIEQKLQEKSSEFKNKGGEIYVK